MWHRIVARAILVSPAAQPKVGHATRTSALYGHHKDDTPPGADGALLKARSSGVSPPAGPHPPLVVLTAFRVAGKEEEEWNGDVAELGAE